MKKFFAKIFKKKSLSFDEQGINATKSDGADVVVLWSKVRKIILLDTFEEYSGYFLTDDYKNKVLYQDISIACNQNVVRIRTGGTPTIKNNTSKPFSRKFGTTSIYYPVFVEYIDDLGCKNLYADHYDDKNKKGLAKQFEEFLPKDKIYQKKKIEGFFPLSEIKKASRK